MNIHMNWCVQCNMMKTVLPKDQWPTYEEDRQKGRYVRGIVSLQFGGYRPANGFINLPKPSLHMRVVRKQCFGSVSGLGSD
jgi:hypothetical protein